MKKRIKFQWHFLENFKGISGNLNLLKSLFISLGMGALVSRIQFARKISVQLTDGGAPFKVLARRNNESHRKKDMKEKV